MEVNDGLKPAAALTCSRWPRGLSATLDGQTKRIRDEEWTRPNKTRSSSKGERNISPYVGRLSVRRSRSLLPCGLLPTNIHHFSWLRSGAQLYSCLHCPKPTRHNRVHCSAAISGAHSLGSFVSKCSVTLSGFLFSLSC